VSERPQDYQAARRLVARLADDALFWAAMDDAAHARRCRRRMEAVDLSALPFCQRGLVAAQRQEAAARIDKTLAGPQRPTSDNPEDMA